LIKESGKRIIVIAGPTAVGKTKAAILLAQKFKTEIISFDSRQCFKELNIGVARPSATELKQVPHHFIASHSIQEPVTAAYFEKYALEKVNELFQHHHTVIMVGGTGMYCKAFCEGLDPIPEIDPAIRKNIIFNFKSGGLEWLQQEIQRLDPEFYKKGEIKNPQRLMRALEVVAGTGKSILSFHNREKKKRDFSIIKIGLELPREELIRNINTRVDKMLQLGLLDEVKYLQPFRTYNALQTVGYAELFEYIDNKVSLETATGNIKINTRQYAKRQMTWFKKDKSFSWFHPDDIPSMQKLLDQQMSKYP